MPYATIKIGIVISLIEVRESIFIGRVDDIQSSISSVSGSFDHRKTGEKR